MENLQKVVLATELWKGFDPSFLPLETTVLRTWTQDGICFEEIFFTAEVKADGKSRVFAVLAHKEGESNLPMLLVISKSGFGADLSRAEYWARQGYAVVCFDNAGESDDASSFTIYPKSLEFCNFAKAGENLDSVKTNAFNTPWYHWAINARRALSALEEKPFVNKKVVGMYSFGDGSLIASQVVAFDKRIKACALMYGSCHVDKEIVIAKDESEEEDSFLIRKAHAEDARERVLAGVAPQSFLLYGTCPIYICVGTNSTTTNMEKVFETLERIPAHTSKNWLFAPRLMDCGNEELATNLDLWLHLALQNSAFEVLPPVLTRKIQDGKLFVEIDTTTDVKNVVFFHSSKNQSPSARHWTKVDCKKSTSFEQEVPVFESCEGVLCFATAQFDNGLFVSSKLMEVSGQELGNVQKQKAQPVLFRGTQEIHPFLIFHPLKCESKGANDLNKLQKAVGPFGLQGIKGKVFSTFALADEQFATENGHPLMVDIFSDEKQVVKFFATTNFGEACQEIFSYEVDLYGGEIWQKVCVSLDSFKNEHGKRLSSWKSVELLTIAVEEPIVINNLVVM